MDEIEGPRFGDSFVTGDDIRGGDLVFWDRDPDGEFILRRLEEWQLASHEGPVYRISRGDGALSFTLTPVK